MGKNTTSGTELKDKQLKKYAHDLSEIYQQEKQKRKELEQANRQLLQYAEDLKSTMFELQEAHKELKESYLDTIHRLVLTAEFKNEDTVNHLIRMGNYCVLLAEKLGLSEKEVENILYSAPLHDIGKIGIPDKILMKPGKLTKAEFEIMKTHTTIGSKILSNSKSEILQTGQTIALSHHEKWNGRGYPMGLAGKDIPLVGRIVALADVFDAVTSERPYKKAYSIETACEIIREEKGQHFDPKLVDIFFDNLEEFKKIKKYISDQNTPKFN
jgi:putative two-component system response regulator